jgi:hypothetical protein
MCRVFRLSRFPVLLSQYTKRHFTGIRKEAIVRRLSLQVQSSLVHKLEPKLMS